MFYFEDYESLITEKEKENYILKSITNFKLGNLYNTAIDAQAYYREENTTILDRLNWFYNSIGAKEEDKFKANNKVCSGFFQKIVKQENSYLLANGITTDDNIKNGLGAKFDNKLQQAGLYSLVDSVSWGYCHLNNLGKFDIDIWRGTEGFALIEESTSLIRAFIRFIQSAPTRPIFVEFYTEEGITNYKIIGDKIEKTKDLQAYRITKGKDILGARILKSETWSRLPIFPLYANDVKTSELTTGLKTKIDCYDLINSDLANNLEDNKDIIYFLKNYAGEDVGEFLADLKLYNVVKTDEEGDVGVKQVEVPYQARKTALELLKEQIYADAMALDTSILSGGSLTNIAIKAMMMDLDLKTDTFESNVISFCDDIIQLYLEFINQPTKEYKIEFIRRGIVNDTEVIDNIIKMRSDISHITALKLNPYIENADEELKLFQEQEPQLYQLPTEEEQIKVEV